MMKKTKSIFAAVMIVVVAGVSGVCWLLNEKGVFGGKNEPVSDEVYVQQGFDNDSDDKKDSDEHETVAENEETVQISKNEINEFLTVFAEAYFCEDKAYTPETRSAYDMLRFAYAHICITNPEKVENREPEGDNISYNCVPSEDVNKILKKYLDITVPDESVFTEQTYAFFKYDDGYFMAPAAGGLPYKNVAEADEVVRNGNNISVRFKVFTGTQLYATGEAGIEVADNGLVLTYYSVNKI